MTSLPALVSLQLDDVMARRIERNSVEAVLRAHVVRVGAGDVERGGIVAAAKIAIRGVTRRWQIRKRLAGCVEDIDSSFIAGAGGGVNVARCVERHAVDASAAAKV